MKVGELDKDVFLEPGDPNDLGVKIIDNFLPQESFDKFYDIVTSPSIPWYYREKKLHQDDVKSFGAWESQQAKVNFHNWQLTHIFYSAKGTSPWDRGWSSPYIDEVRNFLMKNIHTPHVLKIRATFNPSTSENILLGGYHVDVRNARRTITTSIFYMNTNNGYTSFLDGYRVKSVANRLLSFPVQLPHAGVSCTDEQMRIQININYETPEDDE